MECPVCTERKLGYFTFECGHSVCNTCLLHMINHQQQKCPMCRADFVDQVPQEMIDEMENERLEVGSGVMGSRPRRGGGDDGYDSADEIEDDATHIKIRYGAHEVAFIRNDGINKEISFDSGGVSFRVIYRDRKCYLIRKEYPDTPVPLNPLTSMCAVLRPPPPIA